MRFNPFDNYMEIMTMEQYVGLDVSQDVTHMCVVNRDGKILWQAIAPQHQRPSAKQFANMRPM